MNVIVINGLCLLHYAPKDNEHVIEYIADCSVAVVEIMMKSARQAGSDVVKQSFTLVVSSFSFHLHFGEQRSMWCLNYIVIRPAQKHTVPNQVL